MVWGYEIGFFKSQPFKSVPDLKDSMDDFLTGQHVSRAQRKTQRTDRASKKTNAWVCLISYICPGAGRHSRRWVCWRFAEKTWGPWLDKKQSQSFYTIPKGFIRLEEWHQCFQCKLPDSAWWALDTSGNHMFLLSDGLGWWPIPEKCSAGWELERPEQQISFYVFHKE